MGWSAAQYLQFEDERTRPARDLLAQVPLASVRNAIDLGCGPGNSTELIIDRYGVENVSGLDSDDNMLEAARKRLPQTRFDKADLSAWRPSGQPDLLFANAVFQWLPNHLDVFERLSVGILRHLEDRLLAPAIRRPTVSHHEILHNLRGLYLPVANHASKRQKRGLPAHSAAARP